MQSTDVCYDEKAWLRRQVRFRAAKEQQFDRAENAQKIARSFSFHEVAARHPMVLESQIQGQRMKLVDKRWDVPIRQHTKEKNHGTMKAIWTTTSKFGVVWGGLTDEENMKLLSEEKAAKEQKKAKVYSKYVVPDDKTKHVHWIMPVETYEALLATYCCTSEHWCTSSMTKQEASECIEEFMNENLLERWKHEFGLGRAKIQNWLPYSYFTVKSKCHKAEGRVREKKGHSCVRKIVAYTKWPKREAWRRAGRCIETLVRVFGDGWEAWKLNTAPGEVRTGMKLLQSSEKIRRVRAVSKIEIDGVWLGV